MLYVVVFEYVSVGSQAFWWQHGVPHAKYSLDVVGARKSGEVGVVLVLLVKVVGKGEFGGNDVVCPCRVGFRVKNSAPDWWRRCYRVQDGLLCSRRRSGVGGVVAYSIFVRGI